MGKIVNGSGSAFSPWPFDKGEDVRGIVLQESFITAGVVADADGGVVVPGTFVYVDELGAATANVATAASEDNHLGIIALEGGAATDGSGIVATFGPVTATPIKFDSNGVVGSALIRSVNAVANLDLFVGFRQAALAEPARSVDGDVGYLFMGGNADPNKSLAVSNEGTADEEVVLSIMPTEDKWFLVEVAADEDGAYVRVTNEDNHTQVAKLDAVPDTADDYQFCVVACTTGTSEAVVSLDTLQLRSLVGRTSDVDNALI